MTVGNPDAIIATLDDRKRVFKAKKDAHAEAARWFRLRNTYLTFAALLLSALLALPILAAATGNTADVATESASEQPAKEEAAAQQGAAADQTNEGAVRVPLWVQWAAGALAVGSAVVTGFQAKVNDAETSTKHQAAAVGYSDADRDVDRAKLEVSEEKRRQALSEIDENVRQIEDAAPGIPKKYESAIRDAGG